MHDPWRGIEWGAGVGRPLPVSEAGERAPDPEGVQLVPAAIMAVGTALAPSHKRVKSCV